MKWTEIKKLSEGRKKKLASHTYIRKDLDAVIIRFHDTNILKFDSNGVVLDSGGWQTKTTMKRMNAFLSGSGMIVGSESLIWYVTDRKDRWVFKDGMRIRYNGWPARGAKKTVDQAVSESKKMQKKVVKYAEQFVASIDVHDLPSPSLGDCFYCQFQTTDGKTIGDIVNGEHLESHMKENYFVPSLLWNALKEDKLHVVQNSSCKKAIIKYMMKRLSRQIQEGMSA